MNSKDLPTNIARNLLNILQLHGVAHVAVIGAEAVNQFCKGLIVAREMRREKYENEDLYAIPHFSIIIDARENERTRLVFSVIVLRDSSVSRMLSQPEAEQGHSGGAAPQDLDEGHPGGNS